MFVRKGPKTHISTTERLDCVYTPCLPVKTRYLDYFLPTIVVDAGGELNPKLQDDALDTRFRNRETVVKMAAVQ